MKRIWLAAVCVGLTATSFAQAPDKAQVFSSQSMHQEFAALVAAAKAKGSSGTTLGDYGTHAIKISVRTASGGAEVHEHFDDVIIVTGGEATLITGGSLIAPHTRAGGEIGGTGIRVGRQQTIEAGSIVHIPAGTPHQMIIPKGSIFQAFVIKVHEN